MYTFIPLFNAITLIILCKLFMMSLKRKVTILNYNICTIVHIAPTKLSLFCVLFSIAAGVVAVVVNIKDLDAKRSCSMTLYDKPSSAQHVVSDYSPRCLFPLYFCPFAIYSNLPPRFLFLLDVFRT